MTASPGELPLSHHEARARWGMPDDSEGWGSDQLAGELKKESWIVTNAKIKHIMGTDPKLLWNEILRKQGKDYAMLASFSEYPSLN